MSNSSRKCWSCKAPLDATSRCSECGRQQLVLGAPTLSPATNAKPQPSATSPEPVARVQQVGDDGFDNKEEADSPVEVPAASAAQDKAAINTAAASLVSLVEKINEFEACEAASKKKIKELETKTKMAMPEVLANAAYLMTPETKPVSHCQLQSPTCKSFGGALRTIKPPCFGVTQAYAKATSPKGSQKKKNKPAMPPFLAPPKPKLPAKRKAVTKLKSRGSAGIVQHTGSARIKTLEKENARLRQTVNTLRADKDNIESKYDELEAKFEALCQAVRQKQEAQSIINEILEDEVQADGRRSNPLSPSPSYSVPTGADRLE